MSKRSGFALLLGSLAIAACDRTYAKPVGSQKDEAAFRSRAQEMYSWLLMPSCDAPSGFDRRVELADEFRTVDRFEQQLRSAAASSHLQVAREDASFELQRKGVCWEEYSSTVWAEQHVKMTQELVQANLAQLQALAPSLSPLPTDLAGQPEQVAEFRYRVRNLLMGMSPQCPLSKSIPNGDLLGPALDVVAGLKDELADTVFANQFAIAEADAAYALSETLFDCAAPSNSSAEQLRQEMKEYARDQVAAIRPLMRAH